MKITIQGHPTRGKEIIQILESLGGINIRNLRGDGYLCYYLIDGNMITYSSKNILSNYKYYTLEEFEKEFPFKIGDRVISTITNLIGTITKLKESGWYYVKYDSGDLVCVFRQHLKLYKEMQERNITLTFDKAKEWYNKGGELKEVALQAYSEEELSKAELPKTWEEFCDNHLRRNGMYYIDVNSDIKMMSSCINDFVDKNADRNLCPSKKSAQAHLAMIQLEQLRDCWLDGWTPKWDTSNKWCIRLYKNQLHVGLCTDISRFLTFPTREMAEDFLECFRDLIEKARNLI